MGTYFATEGQTDGNEEIDYIILDDLHDAMHSRCRIQMLPAVRTLEIIFPKENTFPREVAATRDNIIDQSGVHVTILQRWEIIIDDARIHRRTRLFADVRQVMGDSVLVYYFTLVVDGGLVCEAKWGQKRIGQFGDMTAQ